MSEVISVYHIILIKAQHPSPLFLLYRWGYLICHCCSTFPFMTNSDVEVEIVINPDPVALLDNLQIPGLGREIPKVFPGSCIGHAHPRMIQHCNDLYNLWCISNPKTSLSPSNSNLLQNSGQIILSH